MVTEGTWTSTWQSFPLAARMGLLIGSVGRAHLLSVASACFSANVAQKYKTRQFLLGQQMFAAAYEHSPLNGPLAASVLNVCGAGLTPLFKAQLSDVAALWQQPQENTLKRLTFLTQKGNKERLIEFLKEETSKNPKNLFWLEQIFDYSLLENEPGIAAKYLPLLPASLAPLKNYLTAVLYLAKAANISFSQKEHNAEDNIDANELLMLAQKALEPIVAEFESNNKNPAAANAAASLPPYNFLRNGKEMGVNMNMGMGTNKVIEAFLPLELAVHIFFLRGERDRALSLGLSLLTKKPWHTNLALRIYEESQNRPSYLPFGAPNTSPNATSAATASLSATNSSKTSLLLYSFNKAGDLDKTLASIADSAGYFYNITVLDNGSHDDTSAVLQRWQQNLGSDIFSIVSLPVNVGAPAARNWLLTTPAVKNSDYSIYVDDDAILPVNGANGANSSALKNSPPPWLCSLKEACELYPEAEAYGIKILDGAAPYEAQSTDLHLYPAPTQNEGEEGASGFALWGNLLANLLEGPERKESRDSLNKLGNFSLTSAHSQNIIMSNLATQSYDMGQFNYIRPCLSVTGCVHMFRSKNILEQGGFNLSFSPSQYDDLERDLRRAKTGSFACYTGLAAAHHMQRTGRGRQMSRPSYGSGLANRYKLNAHFTNEDVLALIKLQTELLEADLLRKLNTLDSLAK